MLLLGPMLFWSFPLWAAATMFQPMILPPRPPVVKAKTPSAP